ncbi:MAG: zinc dependent phospholipase C family protein [Lachnospiraceae bacterium]|nr:zinc dependent phospholipase C family protein [Lachnospiraceae bacterium]
MPGFATHYLFGLTACQELPRGGTAACLRKYARVFGLGLQGPDLFYYSLASFLQPGGNPGILAHHHSTGALLTHMLESRSIFHDTRDRNIASAYIMGFLGHYTLDTVCHPYIYAKSHRQSYGRDYFGHHVYLETDIDTELLMYYKGCAPSEFRQARTIALSRRQQKVVAAVLHYAYSATFPQYHFPEFRIRMAIRAMYSNLRLLRDPSGQKKVLARSIEARLLGHAHISPLITSDFYTFTVDPLNMRHRSWCNPWNGSGRSRRSFFDLMDQARAEYLDILDMAARLFGLPFGTPVYRQRLTELSRRLGSKSYCTGLPEDESPKNS